MFYEHFHLSGPPFEEYVAPSPAIFMSAAHREGFAMLEWGLLHELIGFTLLVGGPGTGKTTLINAALLQHRARLSAAYITNPKFKIEEMLHSILEQLGVNDAGSRKYELIRKMEYVLADLKPGQRIVIIVDEAQGLSDERIEDLRLVSNLGSAAQNQRLHFVLIGQLELLGRLKEAAFRKFDQRIGARAVLNRMTRDESFSYVDYRLRQTGSSAERVFDGAALEFIVKHGAGIARQVNLLCSSAMLTAYAADAPMVTLEHSRAAAAEYERLRPAGADALRPEIFSAIFPFGWSPATMAGLGAAVLALSLSTASLLRLPAHTVVVKAEVASTNPQASPAAEAERAKKSASVSGDARGSVAPVASVIATPAPAPIKAMSVMTEPARIALATTENPMAQTGTRKVVVQRGDTLARLASKYSGFEIEPDELVSANPQLRNINLIYPGDIVFVPISNSHSDHAASTTGKEHATAEDFPAESARHDEFNERAANGTGPGKQEQPAD